MLDHEEGHARLAGVTRCSNPWACPVCAPRIAAARAETLKPQVAALMAQAWTAHLVTLTLRHERQQPLADLWVALGTAWERVTSGKRWQSIRNIGAPEYVRGYDVTHSERHGWHPHVHLALYLPPEHGDGEGVSAWVLQRWVETLARLGWEALPGAQHTQRVDDPEAAAAYAVTPAACYETVALALKRARAGRGGQTPFEILEQAVEDREADLKNPGADRPPSRSIALWQDYVRSTKGKKQVNTSRGLTLRPDDEFDEPHGDEVATLGARSLSELDSRRMLADVLDAAEQGAGCSTAARACVLDVLTLLDADDWTVTNVEPVPPPPPRSVPDNVDLAIPIDPRPPWERPPGRQEARSWLPVDVDGLPVLEPV